MKIICLLLAYNFLSFSLGAKSLIIVEVKNLKKDSHIDVFNPIDDYYNYSQVSESIPIKSDTEKTILIHPKIRKEGYLRLTINSMPLHFYIGVKDTFKISIDFKKMGPKIDEWLSIEGINNKLHLNFNKYVLKRSVYSNLVHIIFEDPKDLNSIANRAFKISDTLYPADALSVSTSSLPLYSIYKKDIEADILLNLLDRFALVIETKNDAELQKRVSEMQPDKKQFKKGFYDTLFDDQNLQRLKDIVYKIFNPFDSSLSKSKYGKGLTLFYLRSAQKTSQNFSLSYDDSFSFLNFYSYLGYAPSSFLQTFLGDNIIYQIEKKANDYNLDSAIRFFKFKYPRSAYVPVIQHLYSSVTKTSTNLNVSDSRPTIILDSNLHFSTLKEIYDNPRLKNKLILIDLWATWCSPCLEEFSYKAKLNELQTRYNFETIYISIDLFKERKKWLSLIKKFNLTGYHIIASARLLKDIKSKVYTNNPDMPVPFYFIVQNNNIRVLDAPRLRDGEKLEELIKKISRKN